MLWLSHLVPLNQAEGTCLILKSFTTAINGKQGLLTGSLSAWGEIETTYYSSIALYYGLHAT